MARLEFQGAIIYTGEVDFTQVTRRIERANGGKASAYVEFAGPVPKLEKFVEKLKKRGIPNIRTFGLPIQDLGNWTGYTVDDHPVFPRVRLSFELSATDKPIREKLEFRSLSVLSVRVQGPGESSYEATYYAPSITYRWQSETNPGTNPRYTSGPPGEVKIIRERLVTDTGTPEDPIFGGDLTPKKSIRIEDYKTAELIEGKLWECECTVAKVLLDDDRS